VYVTARHVVDSLEEAHHANPFLLIPKAVTAEGVDHLVAVPIDSISIAQRPNDLALLRVDLEKAAEAIEDRSLQTGIALRPPDEGENTLALGYPHQAVTDTLRFESELRASHGIVEVIHNETQDTFRRETFPSFWVTGRYEGGMSGGPVFDEHTGVIGVVSRGMTPRDAPPYGIAISIGCLVELGVELKTDDGQVFDYSVSDLSAVGLIKLVGDGSVVLTRDESGLQLTWS
jgi:hypothetical protein